MNISLSKDKFKNLLKVVHLWNWMINGIRLPDELIKEYENIKNSLFKRAEQD